MKGANLLQNGEFASAIAGVKASKLGEMGKIITFAASSSFYPALYLSEMNMNAILRKARVFYLFILK